MEPTAFLEWVNSVMHMFWLGITVLVVGCAWILSSGRDSPVSSQKKTKKLRAETPPTSPLANTSTVGQLSLIMGPMFAGKTSYLLDRLRRQRISSKIQDVGCLLIKSSQDNRYDAKSVVPHHQELRDKNCVIVCDLQDVKASDLEKVQHIFVDEGQFFSDLVPCVLRWIESGRHVTVAALDAYASQEMWPNIASLIPWCHQLKKLSAICNRCGHPAQLTVKNHFTKEDSKLQVGGKELYRASCLVCRRHSQSS